MSEILAGPDEMSPPGATPSAGSAGYGPRTRQWLLFAGIGIALIVIGAILAEVVPIGGGGGGNSGDEAPQAEEAPVATAPPAETVATTLPPDTVANETTVAVAAPPPIDPVGEPIPVEELLLAAAALGPLEIGSDGTEVVGRLVATLGQPTTDSGVVAAAVDFGVCGGRMRMVTWGALTVVTGVDETGAETFVAYRVDGSQASGEADPTTTLQTLSGLAVGNTVADLRSIYDGFQIELTEREGDPAFELYSSAGGLLIWGPITAADDSGTVTGVRSPATCTA